MLQIETLNQFRDRTQGFSRDSLPREGCFETREGLTLKVGRSGEFLPFSGNTTVFLLEEEVKDRIENIQNALYENCGDMLAEPLKKDSFHMTLHDLLNEGAGRAAEADMQRVRTAAAEILHRIWEREKEPVEMRMTWVFNMVNTSVVIGFEPAEEADCRRIMSMYEELQQAVRLNYPLTPHITAAYYKPGRYGRDEIERLAGVFDKLSREPFVIRFRIENLVYQEFTSMNQYETVLI